MEKQLQLTSVALAFLIPIALVAKTSRQTDDYNSCRLPPPATRAEGAVLPQFIEVPLVANRVQEDSVYADIMNHSRNPFISKHGRMIDAHETVHDINSDIRNSHGGAGYNGFYVLEGRGTVLPEPKILKNDVIAYLPKNLRSWRFATYLDGQQAWNERPLYIVDEFSAYVADGIVGVDDVEGDRYRGGWTDGVSGCLDFSIFTTALAMAVYDKDPDYWQRVPEFRIFVKWLLELAYKTYKSGYKMKEFVWQTQEELHNELLHSPEAEPMRNFLKTHFGGVWLQPL